MSSTPIYGFQPGYSLSASPLALFPAASRSTLEQAQQLYTPSIINMNPLTPASVSASVTVGAKSYALAQPSMRNLSAGAGAGGAASIAMCANAPQVANMGASLCMNPQSRMCAPPPVPNQCPQGHIAINQFSGAMGAEPMGVTWGMMTR